MLRCINPNLNKSREFVKADKVKDFFHFLGSLVVHGMEFQEYGNSTSTFLYKSCIQSLSSISQESACDVEVPSLPCNVGDVSDIKGMETADTATCKPSGKSAADKDWILCCKNKSQISQ